MVGDLDVVQVGHREVRVAVNADGRQLHRPGMLKSLPRLAGRSNNYLFDRVNRAGDGIRTRDVQLGKLAFYP